jgi:outer membrane protein TolC
MMPTLLLQGAATNGPAGAPTFGSLENPALLGTNPMSLEGMASDPLKKQYGAGLTVNQTIFDFGRTQHLVAARTDLVGAAKEDASAQVGTMLVSVEQAFYGVLHAQHQLELSEQNLKQRDATLRQAEAFVEGQLRSGVDLQVASANHADAASKLIAAKNDVRFAFAELNHAMGLTSMEEFALAEEGSSVSSSVAKSAEEAMSLAVKQRPEVLSAINQSKASNQQLKAVRSELSPRLDAVGSVGAINKSSLMSDDKNYAVGIELSIPIFSGGYVEGRVSEERQKRATALAQEQMVRESVKLQAAKAWLDLQTRQAQLVSIEQQVAAAEKSLKLASERYNLRLGSIVELNESETLAIQARERLEDARFVVKLATSELAWATGSTFQKYIRDGKLLAPTGAK